MFMESTNFRNVNAPKDILMDKEHNGYIGETINRVLAHHYLTIGETHPEMDVRDGVQNIAHHWKNVPFLENLAGEIKSLIDNAQSTGTSTTEKEIIENGIPSDAIARLRLGGLAGELVGAELLRRMTWEETQQDDLILADPILKIGADFIINYLKDESEERGEIPTELSAFQGGNEYVIEKLEIFKKQILH